MDERRRQFMEKAEQALQAKGRHIQGIRLRCRKCGEHAVTRDVKLAQMFGWAELVQVQGPDYEGLCIDCAP